MNHNFPTIQEIMAIHDDLIVIFGGSPGIRDQGALASALMRPQLGYYDSLIEEAAALKLAEVMRRTRIGTQFNRLAQRHLQHLRTPPPSLQPQSPIQGEKPLLT